MSEREDEYYWAVERKKVLLMWLCLFCKAVCSAPVFGDPAAGGAPMAGAGRAWAPAPGVAAEPAAGAVRAAASLALLVSVLCIR